MCYDSSCKHTWGGAVLVPVVTGVQGSSGHWSKMLVPFQMIRNTKDLIDSQVIRAPSCLAIQLIRKAFSYLAIILRNRLQLFASSMHATKHRHIFWLQYQCTCHKLYWHKLLHFDHTALGLTLPCVTCEGLKSTRLGWLHFITVLHTPRGLCESQNHRLNVPYITRACLLYDMF